MLSVVSIYGLILALQIKSAALAVYSFNGVVLVRELLDVKETTGSATGRKKMTQVMFF